MNALEKLTRRIETAKSFLCVGLDSDITRIPPHLVREEYPLFAFNKTVTDETNRYVCAYKLNSAFYEKEGERGIHQLAMTVDHLKKLYPDIFLILDAKRGDIGSTSAAYAASAFDTLGVDAVTVNPYLGRDALEPFILRRDKVSIVVCKTSNPGSGEFQDIVVNGKPLWRKVAETVSGAWNGFENLMLVIGATYPKQLREARSVIGDMPILVPGVGSQGGELADVLKNGLTKDRRGLVINMSRSVIFAQKPAWAARAAAAAMKHYFT